MLSLASHRIKVPTRSLTSIKSFKFSTESAQQVSISSPTDGYVLENSRSKLIIPALGFGTWGCEHFDNDTMSQSVAHALKIGYRHFDCARVYANEKELGQVFKDAFENGVCKREDLFITSKLFNNEHAPPDGGPPYALNDSLKNLELDYLDAFLIHWPFRNSKYSPPVPFNIEDYAFTLKLLNELSLQGYCKAIGVSNATITKLKGLNDILSWQKIKPPSINQVELHPYLQQKELIDYCKSQNIIVTAAMPLGSPERPERFKRDDDPIPLNDPIIKEIADQVNCSPAQAIIRWHLQRGYSCIPKGTENWMIEQNFDTLKLQLTEEHMNRIADLDKHYRFARAEVYRWKPDQPWEELWDNE